MTITDTDSNSELRGGSLAKPQAICRPYWTTKLLNMGKIGAVLNWNPYEYWVRMTEYGGRS